MRKYRSNGFECPECLGAAFTHRTGRANAGSIIIRKRRCADCGALCTTFEVPAPTSLAKRAITYWDEDARYEARLRKRAKPRKTERRSGYREAPRAPRLDIRIRERNQNDDNPTTD